MNIVYVGDVADFHFRDKITQFCEANVGQKLNVFSGFSIENFDSDIKLETNHVARVDVSRIFFSSKRQKTKNLVKALCYPANLLWLLFYKAANREKIFHCFTMYYIFLMALVGKNFIATPQASEILQRLSFSRLYRMFALFSLKRAKFIIVDSEGMRKTLAEHGLSSILHKNGFDLDLIWQVTEHQKSEDRSGLISLRGIRELYRIDEIISSRNHQKLEQSISFVYPSSDQIYKERILSKFLEGDKDLGMLDKPELYRMLLRNVLAVSIPKSDSSPRSVYEAVMCGCIVAVAEAGYINEIPICMRERIIVVDLEDEAWLQRAYAKAELLVASRYHPSQEAIEMCCSKKLMRKLMDKVYTAL